MIPQKIHYCWFGRNPLPESAKKCIASWRRFFPDYEIIEWNEDNYNLNKLLYVKQAYDSKKYAFVSDYVRFDVLYQYGGIYFDTDVEVIKDFKNILKKGSFMGCEVDPSENQEIKVAPGLGIAASAGMSVYKEILDYYSTQVFINEDGTMNQETVVENTTRILKKNGLRNTMGIQRVQDIYIYPKVFFNPLNNNTGKLDISESTYSIHWYTMSWLDPTTRLKSKITRIFHRFFGEDCFSRFRK